MKKNTTKPNGSSALSVLRSMLSVRRSMFNFGLNLLLLLAASAANAATRYVWQGSPGPAPPYTNWASAAHVIQDAVDVAAPGEEIVVTDGGYATGGRAVETNVMVRHPIVPKSPLEETYRAWLIAKA